MLLRMQDASGRGPWRPGFSGKWVDHIRNFNLPALAEDFGSDLEPMVAAAFRRGLHIGTAVRGVDRFNLWFTESERIKLALLGYKVVDASSCEVLGETDWQALVGSTQPLSKLPIAPKTPA